MKEQTKLSVVLLQLKVLPMQVNRVEWFLIALLGGDIMPTDKTKDAYIRHHTPVGEHGEYIAVRVTFQRLY